MTKIIEEQHTINNGDRINGTFTIRLEDASFDEFMKCRAEIRRMFRFGNMFLSHTEIEEKALANQSELEKRPETPNIPGARVIEPKSSRKRIIIGPKVRSVLKRLTGVDQATICSTLRKEIYNAKHYTNTEIMQMYDTVHKLS